MRKHLCFDHSRNILSTNMKISLFIISITIGIARGQLQCPPTGIYAFAIAGSCERYLRCISGMAIIATCAPGFHFDVVQGQCNAKDVANCNPCAYNSDDEETFIRDPTHCGRFAHCIGTSHFEKMCEYGYYFDTKYNVCARSEEVDC